MSYLGPHGQLVSLRREKVSDFRGIREMSKKQQSHDGRPLFPLGKELLSLQ